MIGLAPFRGRFLICWASDDATLWLQDIITTKETMNCIGFQLQTRVNMFVGILNSTKWDQMTTLTVSFGDIIRGREQNQDKEKSS